MTRGRAIERVTSPEENLHETFTAAVTVRQVRTRHFGDSLSAIVGHGNAAKTLQRVVAVGIFRMS